MVQLRLTEKLRKALAIPISELSAINEESDGFGNWTLNLFVADRRKCVIFVNEKTLYSFITFGLKKSNIAHFPEIFLNCLIQLLELDGFSEKQIHYLVGQYGEIQFTKTASKKVLGNINDLVWHYQHRINSLGGFKYADVGEIIHSLNRMPQRNIGWGYSIEAVKAMAKNA